MDKNNSLSATLKIHQGKEAHLKEPWFPNVFPSGKSHETVQRAIRMGIFNSEGNCCHVLETYADSKAVLAHVANVGSY